MKSEKSWPHGETLEIYKPDTKVKFGEKRNIKGFISTVTITFNLGVLYEVCYWKDDDMKKIILTKDHFTVYNADENKVVPIGFVTKTEKNEST